MTTTVVIGLFKRFFIVPLFKINFNAILIPWDGSLYLFYKKAVMLKPVKEAAL